MSNMGTTTMSIWDALLLIKLSLEKGLIDNAVAIVNQLLEQKPKAGE
jgi:hypothetical protein